jgi:lipoate---protein ligase
MTTIMSRSPVSRKPRLNVIDLGAASTVDTLAVADGIAARLDREGDLVLVLADPVEPFLCVGANEDIEQRIDLLFCRYERIPVLRRSIGGRAIYIDRNQLIFHVIMPLSRAPRPPARIMPMVVAAMIDTVRDFGLAARLRDPSDVLVGGRKIAGAAGAEVGDTVVVGGTFLFDFDRTRMVGCLKAPSAVFRARLHRLLGARLTTLGEELGDIPSRRRVKSRFVGYVASRLDAGPHQACIPRACEPAIAAAAAQLEILAWRA